MRITNRSGNKREKQTPAPGNAADTGTTPRLKGKYTGKSSGHCKYGGWSTDGIKRFNELRKLVEEDRACPQAETMEKELLEFCRSQSKGGRNNGRETPQVEQGNNLVGSEVMDATFEEAGWDSD